MFIPYRLVSCVVRSRSRRFKWLDVGICALLFVCCSTSLARCYKSYVCNTLHMHHDNMPSELKQVALPCEKYFPRETQP